ncbi:hypothetical protein FBZ89_108113 [Nitrospirillum amazonense]|uniref:Uncharacterized protein n=1 Tax=Nitrospirillum amazonense TaxID=28077 RepID=A0A560FBR2_9PROT|nr:hypothetical protein [Nitrospirillum amazonense]TWB19056.1 hypothetical protein FBZ89_108113 [Nitrospirillum amazonense]
MTPPDIPDTDLQAIDPARALYSQDPDGAAARMRHLFQAGTAGQAADCRALAELLLNAATDMTAGDALAVEAILDRQPPEMRGWLLQRATALAAASGVVRHKIASAANLQ